MAGRQDGNTVSGNFISGGTALIGNNIQAGRDIIQNFSKRCDLRRNDRLTDFKQVLQILRKSASRLYS